MSQPKQQPDDPRAPDAAERKRDTAKLGPPPDPEQPDPATGLKYVFKIAPADPKNSLDFEDVADK